MLNIWSLLLAFVVWFGHIPSFFGLFNFVFLIFVANWFFLPLHPPQVYSGVADSRIWWVVLTAGNEAWLSQSEAARIRRRRVWLEVRQSQIG